VSNGVAKQRELGGALALLGGFWLALIPLFVVWLRRDGTFAPWDMAYHSWVILNLRDRLLHLNPYRIYELSKYYPPLFHLLASPAAFFTTNPDAFCLGNWIALLGLIVATFLLGRALAGTAAGLFGALTVPAYGAVTEMGRMVMTDLTLTATVAVTLWLLVRGRRLDEGRQAHWLGLSIALGLLAKWPYGFFLFLPLLELVHTHWRGHRRELGSVAFWRPLLVLCLWPALLAGPWYVRSVDYIVSQAPKYLGSAVMEAEGDPATFSLQSLLYYPRALLELYFTPPTLALFVVGAVVLMWSWRRGGESEVAAPKRWLPLLLAATGGLACLVLITNKNGRYVMPLVPVLAAVSGVAVCALAPRMRAPATFAWAIVAYVIIVWNLFVLSPPNPVDCKIEPLAQWFVETMQAQGRKLRIAVVPNDEMLNFMSLDYAIERTLPKVDVLRVEQRLDPSSLNDFDCAVVLKPPVEETVLSRHSIENTRLVVEGSGWTERFAIARGDGRTIRVLCAPT
jgi:4-amino-4-deoxy-L-arabinose transferase-like glycosyltransferase